jgi:ferritin
MRLSQNLNDSLNEQVLHELHNRLVYAQIASYFEDLQLKNLASYFQKQSSHENDHANLFIKHINDRTGGKIILGEIDAPMVTENIESIANLYVSLEEQTTESIESLYDLALFEKSYMDLGFLQKMLDEQCEEEDSAVELATKLKMCKDLVLFDATLE